MSVAVADGNRSAAEGDCIVRVGSGTISGGGVALRERVRIIGGSSRGVIGTNVTVSEEGGAVTGIGVTVGGPRRGVVGRVACVSGRAVTSRGRRDTVPGQRVRLVGASGAMKYQARMVAGRLRIGRRSRDYVNGRRCAVSSSRAMCPTSA
ncbi:MAG TPA: hypothetical protein VJN70_06280 [Gemmatimonadaceae bacterium]|nr:hypothetical protein [Gemmatimonadaceae bacterium]